MAISEPVLVSIDFFLITQLYKNNDEAVFCMHCGSDQLKIVAVAFSAVQGASLVLSVKA